MFLIQLKPKDVKKVKQAFSKATSFIGEKATNALSSVNKSQEQKLLEYQIMLKELELECLELELKKQGK